MERRRQEAETQSSGDARADYVVRLAKNPVRSPLGSLIALLDPRSPAELAALFDNRVSVEAVRKWIERRRWPAWAAETLATKARATCERRIIEAAASIGPGMGWNKNATRGLGEWRAKRNLEKRES